MRVDSGGGNGPLIPGAGAGQRGIPLGAYGIVGEQIPVGAKGSGTIAQRQFYKESPKTKKTRRRRRRI